MNKYRLQIMCHAHMCVYTYVHVQFRRYVYKYMCTYLNMSVCKHNMYLYVFQYNYKHVCFLSLYVFVGCFCPVAPPPLSNKKMVNSPR